MTPKWLRMLERYLGWLSVPNIAVIFVTLQALGFLMVMADPVWMERLALIPSLVTQGEYWRLITWLSLPVTLSPIWLLFGLWFSYFIISSIENEWGEFQTTLYFLISILLTIGFSFTFDYPITTTSDFSSSLFLAAAALYPEMEIRLFLAIPVKMKWLGWLTLAFIGFRAFSADWIGKLYLVAIYSNYLVFFGPTLADRIRQEVRRRRFRSKFR